MNSAISRTAGLAAAAFAGCGILSAAFAAEYSWQVSGSYLDGDAAATARTRGSALQATYYLSAADDEAGPYELAPFLNRSSHVSVLAARTKLREQVHPALIASDTYSVPGEPVVPGVPGVPVGAPGDGVFRSIGPFPPEDYPPYPFQAESGIETSEYAVAGRYVWPGSGWYAGAQARQGGGDLSPGWPFGQTELDREATRAFVGRYFGPRTTLELGIESETVGQETLAYPYPYPYPFGGDATSAFPGPIEIDVFDFRTRTEVETDHARLSVRHVGDLGESTFEVSAGAHASRSETRFFLPFPPIIAEPLAPFDSYVPPGGRVYLDPGTSFFDFPQSERERGFSLSGALFPTAALGVRLTFSSSDHDTFGLADSVNLSANWFFLRNAAVEVELSRTDSRGGGGFGPDTDDMDSAAVRLLGRF